MIKIEDLKKKLIEIESNSTSIHSSLVSYNNHNNELQVQCLQQWIDGIGKPAVEKCLTLEMQCKEYLEYKKFKEKYSHLLQKMKQYKIQTQQKMDIYQESIAELELLMIENEAELNIENAGIIAKLEDEILELHEKNHQQRRLRKSTLLEEKRIKDNLQAQVWFYFF